MKTRVATLLLCALLTGCGAGFNPEKCLESVIKVYPNSAVYKLGRSDYRFLVIHEGNPLIVATLASGHTGITSVKRLARLSYD